MYIYTINMYIKLLYVILWKTILEKWEYILGNASSMLSSEKTL